jgi:hypothetical protein
MSATVPTGTHPTATATTAVSTAPARAVEICRRPYVS